jgi:tRNA modification GTPase
LPELPESGRYWYGQFGGPPGDQVVVAPHGADSVELHCHGGPAAVRMVLDELSRRGAIARSATELLGDPVRAELVVAPTLRTAGVLLDQANGAFRRAIDAILGNLEAGNIDEVRRRLSEMSRYSPVGRHLTRPWRVVVAGAPNVGKSSLVNALVGYQRSVVTPIAGTTRDVVATAAAIDGWPVELIDTAGRRTTTDDLEGRGIARAESAVAAADLCLWVLDVSGPPAWPNPIPVNCLFVLNKSDLAATWDTTAMRDGATVSARTGDGIADLCVRISGRLVPTPPPLGAAVPFTRGLADAVAQAESLLNAGARNAARAALAAIGQSLRPAPLG